MVGGEFATGGDKGRLTWAEMSCAVPTTAGADCFEMLATRSKSHSKEASAKLPQGL
jgi:hypothetical protein